MCREFLVYRLARGRHVVLAVTAGIGSGAVSGRAIGKGGEDMGLALALDTGRGGGDPWHQLGLRREGGARAVISFAIKHLSPGTHGHGQDRQDPCSEMLLPVSVFTKMTARVWTWIKGKCLQGSNT